MFKLSDWNSIVETLYFISIPGLIKSIKDGLETPIDECVHENDVNW